MAWYWLVHFTVPKPKKKPRKRKSSTIMSLRSCHLFDWLTDFPCHCAYFSLPLTHTRRPKLLLFCVGTKINVNCAKICLYRTVLLVSKLLHSSISFAQFHVFPAWKSKSRWRKTFTLSMNWLTIYSTERSLCFFPLFLVDVGMWPGHAIYVCVCLQMCMWWKYPNPWNQFMH